MLQSFAMMNRRQILAVLNRLLAIQCRSLPQYLQQARPWTCRDDEPVLASLDNIVADQRAMAQRISDAIGQLDGRPTVGSFPSDFTDVNDLAMHALLPRLIAAQRQDIATLEQCSDELITVGELHELAEEALGAAKGYLEILEQHVRP